MSLHSIYITMARIQAVTILVPSWKQRASWTNYYKLYFTAVGIEPFETRAGPIQMYKIYDVQMSRGSLIHIVKAVRLAVNRSDHTGEKASWMESEYGKTSYARQNQRYQITFWYGLLDVVQKVNYITAVTFYTFRQICARMSDELKFLLGPELSISRSNLFEKRLKLVIDRHD